VSADGPASAPPSGVTAAAPPTGACQYVKYFFELCVVCRHAKIQHQMAATLYPLLALSDRGTQLDLTT
jgi:hypothetical protein